MNPKAIVIAGGVAGGSLLAAFVTARRLARLGPETFLAAVPDLERCEICGHPRTEPGAPICADRHSPPIAVARPPAIYNDPYDVVEEWGRHGYLGHRLRSQPADALWRESWPLGPL